MFSLYLYDYLFIYLFIYLFWNKLESPSISLLLFYGKSLDGLFRVSFV